MENQLKIPKLRFPEFVVEWEVKKLEDLCKMQAGKFVNASEINDEFDFDLYPCYGGNGLRGYTKSFNQNGKYTLIDRQGAKCGNVTLAVGKFYATEHAVVVSLNQGLDSVWIYYLLGNLNLNQYSTGLAQPGLSIQNLEKIEAILPTLPEQTKIANFLTAVDDKLTQLKKKKCLLEQYKKGVMQKLFLQELRFKDENGEDFEDWEEKRFGDMISLVIDNRGKTPPTIDAGIPLLEVNSIGNKEINYKAVSKYVTTETYNNWFRKYLEQGDILFSTVGNTALCSYYDGSRKAGIAQNIVGLRFKNEFSLFMYYLLIEERNRNKFKQIEMGAVQPSVKVSQMVDLYFDVPSFSEQTKIAKFLSSIDDKINHCGLQIEKMERWKKGLLQQMFV